MARMFRGPKAEKKKRDAKLKHKRSKNRVKGYYVGDKEAQKRKLFKTGEHNGRRKRRLRTLQGEVPGV